MRARTRLGGIVALSAALLGASCKAPRPQLLIIVDTDAALGAQLLAHGAAAESGISPDAVIDTVRIDRFDDAWHPVCLDDVDCTANFVLPEPSLWPFSFGVATPAAGSTTLRLRVRAFRGALAARGTDHIGARTFATIDPPPEATIDRLVELALPPSGEVTARVFLAEDCLAVPVSFGKAPRTCVGGASRVASPADGVEVGGNAEPGATRAGTWPRARSVACGAAPAGVDALCIAGGFSFLGEAALAGVDEQSYVPAVPPRPVYLDPFYMDRTELTVGRMRELVNQGLVVTAGDPSGPVPTDTQLAQCEWLGASEPANDAYPINCLSWGVARQACVMSGGDLPTEAQWEYAARGRGQARIYPWGDQSPDCSTTSAGLGSLCPVADPGPEKVGSHAASAVCGALCDVSRDGIVDLGGNVAEFCADRLVSYAEGCWSTPGVFLDPRCEDTTVGQRAVRGGDWNSGPANTRAAFRRGDQRDSLHGFRCVYPGVAQ